MGMSAEQVGDQGDRARSARSQSGWLGIRTPRIETRPRILLSAVVVAELYSGVKSSTEEASLGDVIGLFRVVEITGEIAKIGGLYKRDYGSSHGVGLADALLAATAGVEGAKLATLNVRHYPMVQGLRPAYRKSARTSDS